MSTSAHNTTKMHEPATSTLKTFTVKFYCRKITQNYDYTKQKKKYNKIILRKRNN